MSAAEKPRPRRARRLLVAAVALVATAASLSACGDEEEPGDGPGALDDYLARVEPIRLGTNRLLDRADPILSAYHEGEIGPAEAQKRVEDLERRLAGYAVDIAAVDSVPESILPEHEDYAHTWVFEDSYLSALAAAVPEREFDELPDTQDRQRAAIIAWRIRLEVLADELGINLPADIQRAGRGEIAPSPIGE